MQGNAIHMSEMADYHHPMVLNFNASNPVCLVCEHASSYIPAEMGDLGLSGDILTSHIAWDPGALKVATTLSTKLDAVLICGGVSRLVYDCNRPPEADGAIAVRSETTDIPGNQDITTPERKQRIENFYRPFEQQVSAHVSKLCNPSALITVHSFTPVYLGKKRTVEIGVLHDDDSRLADSMLKELPTFTSAQIERNQPYGPADGVTHTLKRHGLKHNLLNVMIEIRSDLIMTEKQCNEMAQILADAIKASLAQCNIKLMVKE